MVFRLDAVDSSMRDREGLVSCRAPPPAARDTASARAVHAEMCSSQLKTLQNAVDELTMQDSVANGYLGLGRWRQCRYGSDVLMRSFLGASMRSEDDRGGDSWAVEAAVTSSNNVTYR